MSKPILFHIPFYSSSPAVVAVHELGLADTIEVRNSSDGQHKVGEIGANNPHGFVPLLKTDNGEYLIESGAILMYLVEKYKGRDDTLWGKPETRSKMYQWLFYCPATIYPKITPPFADEEFKKDAVRMGSLRSEMEKTFHFLVEQALKSSDYLLGDEFSIADVMVGYYVFCMKILGWIDENTHPKMVGYLARLMARPSFQQAFPQ